MGSEFSSLITQEGGFDVVGITSSKEKASSEILYAQLLDLASVYDAISRIDLDNYEEIYVIHAVGPFVFEGESLGVPYDEIKIDKDVYSNNFATFVNLFKAISRYVGSQPITWIAFGSVSDSYEIPFWKSYSVAKNDLRRFMRDIKGINSRCVMVNVSSTEKEEERPFADKSYWLSCREVAQKSLPLILSKNVPWVEVDIIKPMPNFDSEYYRDHKKIYNKWMKEMYGGVKKQNKKSGQG